MTSSEELIFVVAELRQRLCVHVQGQRQDNGGDSEQGLQSGIWYPQVRVHAGRIANRE